MAGSSGWGCGHRDLEGGHHGRLPGLGAAAVAGEHGRDGQKEQGKEETGHREAVEENIQVGPTCWHTRPLYLLEPPQPQRSDHGEGAGDQDIPDDTRHQVWGSTSGLGP
ncbi:hypothetical protein GCM10009867_32770 [Pedococcus aerophilus]|uniref:Uncharacterized protein n=1 Tax=Pedococcus aerophilus TaxID=436356 RepID=A0ABN3UV98_9MICO